MNNLPFYGILIVFAFFLGLIFVVGTRMADALTYQTDTGIMIACTQEWQDTYNTDITSAPGVTFFGDPLECYKGMKKSIKSGTY